MFKVNDVIVYGTHGVCRIEAMEEKTVSGVKKMYYVLKPQKDQSATIYAPMNNEYILKKMRRLLTKEEIHQLIDSMPEENIAWTANDAERKELYQRILSGGDHSQLIRMIKAIYEHKKSREAAGKRLHMIDERFFKDAEQILYHEFQYVLNLSSREELMQYILNRLH